MVSVRLTIEGDRSGLSIIYGNDCLWCLLLLESFIGYTAEMNIRSAERRGRSVVLCPGDCLFVYTDGVPDAKNSADERFGPKHPEEKVKQTQGRRKAF